MRISSSPRIRIPIAMRAESRQEAERSPFTELAPTLKERWPIEKWDLVKLDRITQNWRHHEHALPREDGTVSHNVMRDEGAVTTFVRHLPMEAVLRRHQYGYTLDGKEQQAVPEVLLSLPTDPAGHPIHCRPREFA